MSVDSDNQTRVVDRESIAQFAELTGDFSQIHLDHEYALAAGLRDNYAHGLLGASWAGGWLSQVQQSDTSRAGMPVEVEFNFGIPVFCNDALTLHSEHNGSEGYQFQLFNNDNQTTSHGFMSFSSIDAVAGIEKNAPPQALQPGTFEANPSKVYYARDMYEDGPRGFCEPYVFTHEKVAQYLDYTGELDLPYKDDSGEVHWVPPVFIFCRMFSNWLKAFLDVKTPDGSFPGHIKDQFRQHSPVVVGDGLRACHQVTAYRQSKSRPDMAIITISIQALNQRDEIVQSGSVLIMMNDQA